jgi:hypothetical protein
VIRAIPARPRAKLSRHFAHAGAEFAVSCATAAPGSVPPESPRGATRGSICPEKTAARLPRAAPRGAGQECPARPRPEFTCAAPSPRDLRGGLIH